LVAGAVANRSESVVGISNVFAVGDDLDGAWAGCLAAIARLYPGVPVVGYEHGEDLQVAARQGFTPIGPLRVWWRAACAVSI